MPGKRILIIDDNFDHVEALAELLRLSGHRVAGFEAHLVEPIDVAVIERLLDD